MHGAQHVHARAAFELVVEQHAIGIRAQDAFDRVAGRTCIANDLDTFDLADKLAQTVAHRGQVVDDEDPRAHGSHCRSAPGVHGIGAR